MAIPGKQKKPHYRSAAAWHRYWVLNDPEFLKELHDQVVEGVEKPEDYFAKKYFISQGEINSFIVGLGDQDPEPVNSLFGITNSVEGKTITVRFSQDITRQQYEQNWAFINWYKEKVLFITPPNSKKLKSPENTKLIYAIFRARNNEQPKTFREIFRLYQDKELPYYENGGNTALSSEEALERYYNKYRPKPTSQL